ncbi:type IV secretion system DNA-binding domain-containing protein [Waterburya agarophytonicola K14]|uniref:Type IV secretion system DNA-binding domain-containing protein n=1 Tax=Waterburya agarophytonicola KI4 TaxID=2874699 RepID=A0A964FG44_9CYAN|nr:type IV secretion system DNA-binding domain-containing protein [Waterburya agarophytonicola]MCC0178555.1 type IV secretion system DNA-binding domain-containing protein [Waterburya agarophytonicola KI4]
MKFKEQFLRGVKIEESTNKIQALLDRHNDKIDKSRHDFHLPQLSIAGLRLPHNLEDLGIFCVGSPGSGKTQAIAKLISELKQRPDYRVVCFDRNGEFTANFYNEKQDLIFNPKDKRSLGWSHNWESASNETIAASIIPDHHHTDKFWSDSARNLLSEIYERTSNKAEIEGSCHMVQPYMISHLSTPFEPYLDRNFLSKHCLV